MTFIGQCPMIIKYTYSLTSAVGANNYFSWAGIPVICVLWLVQPYVSRSQQAGRITGKTGLATLFHLSSISTRYKRKFQIGKPKR